MDVQNCIVSGFASDPELISHLQHDAAAARKASIPIITTKQRDSIEAFRLEENDAQTDIAASLTPQTGDIIVTKRRVSAFSGSDLEIVLRARGISHLVLDWYRN